MLMPYQEELIYNEEDEVQDKGDVTLPKFAHHLKIRAEINRLVEMDKLTAEEGDELFAKWRSDRQ